MATKPTKTNTRNTKQIALTGKKTTGKKTYSFGSKNYAPKTYVPKKFKRPAPDTSIPSTELTSELESSLLTTCRSSIEGFKPFGESIDNPDGQLLHVDNGSDILAVCHLDTVTSANRAPAIKGSGRGRYITCGQLDDRLGAWALLHYLPTLTDVKYDILLCDCEEQGNSTAQHFDPSTLNKNYRYMFELDRAGTDVVLYQYDTKPIVKRLESLDWSIGNGAFSDISYLEHLRVVGINFGIGYHRQHTTDCYAYLDETTDQCNRVAKFLDATVGEIFPCEPTQRRSGFGFCQDVDDGGWYTDDDYAIARVDDDDAASETVVCPTCGTLLSAYSNHWCFCPYCGTDI